MNHDEDISIPTDFNGFSTVFVPSFTGFYWVLPGIVDFYRVLPSFTDFYLF